MRKIEYEKSLQYCNSELATEWHPTRNGTLTPRDITANSNKKVWWYLPYDDPVTGKHFDFEWEAKICNRNKGRGCPFIIGKKVWVGFNDLATVNPELAKEWHPIKNGKLTPRDVTANSDEKVWWIYPYDDAVTGKHFDFEWMATVDKRSKGTGCPYLSGQNVWQGYNDLETVYPELAKEWHPTKNGNYNPKNITCGSSYNAWWKKEYKDPRSGKIFVFEWKASVHKRTKGGGCPYINGRKVYAGFNDLKTVNPRLASEWHSIKNGSLRPTDVTANSNKKVWWIYPYDDPRTGKHFDFEWMALVNSRSTMGKDGCPFLSGNRIWKGFNDLETLYPELSKEWYYEKNNGMSPSDFMPSSREEVWWICPYDDLETGKHFDFVWKTKIVNRVYGDKCPFISNRRVYIGFNDLESRRKDLALEWDYEKNKKDNPNTIMWRSTKKRWWKCPFCGKSWYASPKKRIGGQDCRCKYE